MSTKMCIWFQWSLGLLLVFLMANVKSMTGREDRLNVTDSCIDQCSLQNWAEELDNDLWCDAECRTQFCRAGCERWTDALILGCFNVCNSTEGKIRGQSSYCLIGCNSAVSTFVNGFRGELRPPSLFSGSVTNASVELQWDSPWPPEAWPAAQNPERRLQWLCCWSDQLFGSLGQAGSTATWQDVPIERLRPTSNPWRFIIDGLRPYTTYKFRWVMSLAINREPLVSSESGPIRTLAHGFPGSAPLNLNAQADDCTQISLFWQPPLWPNGPLLAYLLNITEIPLDRTMFEDVKVTNNKSPSHTFTRLKPNTTYRISVAARNAAGVGPAAQVQVTTPPRSADRLYPEAMFYIATRVPNGSQIWKQSNIFDLGTNVYESLYPITGLAGHQHHKTLFVADSQGKITQLSISTDHKPEQWQIPDHLDWLIKDLSVDWLANRLYILMGENGVLKGRQKWQIGRCEFDGRNHQVVISDLAYQPVHIEVDPINGFLFWTVQDPDYGGLYRIDLADLSSVAISGSHPKIERILFDPLGSFTIDSTRSQVLVVNTSSLSIVKFDLRNSKPDLIWNHDQHINNVSSLTYLDENFYWINNGLIVSVEASSSPLEHAHRVCTALVLFHVRSQPIPAPVAPVRHLQAVFGSDSSIISWDPPSNVPWKGKGAWQNWSYEVLVEKRDGSLTRHVTNRTRLDVDGLVANATYLIRVQASSDSGTGPGTEEPFVGQTLPDVGPVPDLFWATSQAILNSDVLGQNVRTFADLSSFQIPGSDPVRIVSMSWLNQSLYVVTNTCRMYSIDMASKNVTHLTMVTQQQPISVATDWLGQKIYWSTLQSLIQRANPNGTQLERIRSTKVAKHLTIHSILGRLAWITDNSVEGSLLNGHQHCTYWTGVHSNRGKETAVGLTVDFDADQLYWIVQEEHRVILFRAAISSSCSHKRVKTIESASAIGPLQFVSGRLLWLENATTAVVSSFGSHNLSRLHPTSQSSSSLLVVEHWRPKLPWVSVNVTPEPVDGNSIKVVQLREANGTQVLNISWTPGRNVNYEFQIRIPDHQPFDKQLNVPWIKIPADLKIAPRSNLTISIRPYTIWSSASPTIVQRFLGNVTRCYVLSDDQPNQTHCSESPIPQLVVFTRNSFYLADVDIHSVSHFHGKKVYAIQSPPVAIASLSRANLLFWLDERSIYFHNFKIDQPLKIRQLNALGTSLVVDWVGRHLYWSELDQSKNRTFIYRFELDQEWRQNSPQLILSSTEKTRLVLVNPLGSRLILTSTSADGSGKLMMRHLNGSHPTNFFRRTASHQNGSCQQLNDEGVTLTAVDWTHKEPRIWWISAKSSDVWSADWIGTQCRLELSSKQLQRAGWPPTSIAVDHLYFYWSNSSEGRVYIIERWLPDYRLDVSSPALRTDSISNEIVSEVGAVLAFGNNHQLLPAECLNPLDVHYVAGLLNSTGYSLTLRMPSARRYENCSSISLASLRYEIYYGPVDPNGTKGCETSIQHCLQKKSMESVVELKELLPRTTYAIHVRVTNWYSQGEKFIPQGKPAKFETKSGAPSSVRNVRYIQLSPRSIEFQWLEPEKLNAINVSYSVLWHNSHSLASANQTRRRFECNDTLIDLFQPAQEYTFRIRAYSDNLSLFTDSQPFRIRMYDEPPLLKLHNATPHSLTLLWSTPKDNIIARCTLEMTMNDKDPNSWKNISSVRSVRNNLPYSFPVTGLNLKTWYSFRLRLNYVNSSITYLWPSPDRNLERHSTFETLGSVPDSPKSPGVSRELTHIKVWWAPPNSNGYPIQYYIVQMTRNDEGAPREQNTSREHQKMQHSVAAIENWTTICNTTDTYFLVHNLTSGYKYQFRVQAVNRLGPGPFSPESAPTSQDPAELLLNNQNFKMIVGVFVTFLVAFCAVMSAFIFYACRRSESKKTGPSTGRQVPGVELSSLSCPDLATLRELPQREGFIQKNNAIYGVGDVDLDEELALLPHIRREDLTLTKFLGSGAFGKVYEGLATQLPGTNQIGARVAVKTLRKGATDQEKNEFLKEALLMSHFKHDHILRLLGVCLDSNLNFILLELMEGGDLLSFLRNSRPTPHHGCQLSLLDLVSMCVDVAKGCCYLEELHFVHRDLAARNCLVSSADPAFRVVKIGDFGLARDIYRNDYYRKEGEGLLPVRWMAPESLVDGVFTSQTDVWSFGVLLWEILTLGQQPYPARTNLQVLNFVRNGGRLDRPPNCSDSLFQLMKRCWSYEPCSRPSFSECLSDLLELQTRLQHLPMAVHNGHYVGTTLCRGCDNIAYFQDENHNAKTKDSWNGRENSASYVDNEEMRSAQGPQVQYTNVTPWTIQVDPKMTRARRIERRSSDRLRPVNSTRPEIPRPCSSNGTSYSSGRYLELLSDRLFITSTAHDGYEIPRHVSQPMFPKTNGLLQQQFHSSTASNSQVDVTDDCLSDVTDESCVAHSPTPLCVNQIFRLSSSSDVTATPSDTDC